MIIKLRDCFSTVILPLMFATVIAGTMYYFCEAESLLPFIEKLIQYSNDFFICAFTALLAIFSLLSAISTKEWFEKIKELKVFASILFRLRFCIVFCFASPILLLLFDLVLQYEFNHFPILAYFFIFLLLFILFVLFANIFILMKIFELMLKTGKEKK